MRKFNSVSLYILAIVLIIVIAISSFVVFKNMPYISVRGHNISRDEINMHVYKNLAYVESKYTNEQISSDGFWHTEIDGVKPIDYLYELAESDAIYNKMIQILALENGLATDISYKSMMKELGIRNKEDTISPMGELQYYDYIQSQYGIGLKDIFISQIDDDDDKRILEFYEAKKETSYRELGDIRAEYGIMLEDALVNTSTIELNGTTARSIEESNPELYINMLDLSDKNNHITWTDDNDIVHSLRLISISDGEYIPFHENILIIKNDYVQSSFKDIIKSHFTPDNILINSLLRGKPYINK